MDFSFRAGDRGSPPPHRSNSYLGLPGMQGHLPPMRPFESEALPLQIFRKVRAVVQFIGEEAARQEQLSPEEVALLLDQIMRKMRNLELDLVELANIEEDRREFEVRQSLAFARGHHGRFGPNPFFAPDHFMPPLPMNSPPMHAPPPMQLEWFGAWQGFDQFGPSRHAGFGERMPFRREERRRQSPLLPRTQMPAMDETFQGTEVLPSKSKVRRMKRKSDAIGVTAVPNKVQKPANDPRCHVNEVGLNGRSTHRARLPHCGASKGINDDKNYSQTTTNTGNKNNTGTDLCDAPTKVCMPGDGTTHEVVQKNNLRCDDCRVNSDSDEAMVVHLRSKEHYIMVWSWIEAMRMNTETKGGLASPCESKPESVVEASEQIACEEE